MKSRKGKKRNMSNAAKDREVDRQIKGVNGKIFVIGRSSGKPSHNGSGSGVIGLVRSLGVKPDQRWHGRNRDHAMSLEEQIEAWYAQKKD